MPLVCRNCGYSRPTSVGDPGAACPVCKTPYPEDDLAVFATGRANRYGVLAGAIVAVVFLAAGAGLWHLLFGGAEKPPERRLSLKDEFTEAASIPWIEDYHQGVAYALGMKRITGCGSFRYKRIPERVEIYLVECSDRYDRKTGYKVGPDSGLVLGPLHFLDAR